MPARRPSRATRAITAADARAARLAAIALLARRDFTTGELRQRLTAQGFDEAAASSAIELLAGERTLDDERYAQNYVAYHAGRGHGPLRIASDLRRRGLAEDLIHAALESAGDWSALARKVCRAKFGAHAPTTWAQRARQARFLQYRGFSSDHIRLATGADFDTGLTDT